MQVDTERTLDLKPSRYYVGLEATLHDKAVADWECDLIWGSLSCSQEARLRRPPGAGIAVGDGSMLSRGSGGMAMPRVLSARRAHCLAIAVWRTLRLEAAPSTRPPRERLCVYGNIHALKSGRPGSVQLVETAVEGVRRDIARIWEKPNRPPLAGTC